MFYTIATAGHIDHGKSTLVKALTGIDPDRLPEEIERQMTIDLGFAWFNLPDGSEVGIVDVPGHERFIRNMISGVGGIDYVLFVVAADDGWMPQSQEHLEILDLLDHRHGAVVLTKTDLVKAEWIELVCEDIRTKTAGTFLQDAPILKFSAKGNEGLDAILRHLAEALPSLPPRYNPARPRLFIDRVFSLAGIGTVVTGTMRDGDFSLGDEAAIVPGEKSAKIKSIQTFKQQREHAFQGARAAISLTGVTRDEIARGDCLVLPSDWKGTREIAARLTLSRLNRIPLTHRRKVTVLLGTTELDATVGVFRDDKLVPGGEGVCLLSFPRPVLARLGDRVILRYPTPDILIGGGVVVDVDLVRFARRDDSMREFYVQRRLDSIPELVLSELRKYRTRNSHELLAAANFDREEVRTALKQLIADGRVESFGAFLITSEYKAALLDKVMEFLRQFHRDQPARPGVSKSEIISRLDLDPPAADFALEHLVQSGKLEIKNKLVALSGHQTSLNPEQQRLRTEILGKLAVPSLMTPTRWEIEQKVHVVKEVLNYLIQSGEVIELADGILYRAEDFERITDTIRKVLARSGMIEVKDVKDIFGLTRKYTIPIMEKLDELGVTERQGDKRIPKG